MSQNNNNDSFDWEELLSRDYGEKPKVPETPKPVEAPKKPASLSEDDILAELFAELRMENPPAPAPKPAPVAEPVVEPAPAPIPEPIPEPVVEPEPVVAPTPEPAPEPEPQKKKKAEVKAKPEEEDDELAFDYETEREYMPIKPSRVGRTGCLGGLMYATFVISLSIICACVAWMYASDVLALNKPELTATITLPNTEFLTVEVDVTDDEGNVTGTEELLVADIDYVAGQLYDAGIINYTFLFKLYAAVSSADEKIDSGTYELSTAFDYRALVNKMTAGSPSQLLTTLTFPEGYTMEQMFELLEENNICSMSNLVETATNYNFNYSFLDEESLGDEKRLEGFLFPDTYDFYEGEPAYSVINKMLYNFYYRFTAEMIDKTEAKGLTMRELVAIASMIEKEAGTDDERATIASVIYNRIAQNMPLQIDATIQYILDERVSVLSFEDLEIDSPYNTYMYTGLPPTPIANPGIASINAAISPSSTNYLYYALDVESGSHVFFSNYYEHQAFVATQDYGE